MRMLLVATLLVLLPAAGWAGTASHGCGYTGTVAGTAGTALGGGATKKVVAANERWCYRFVNADATTTIVGPLTVTSPSAVVLLDADLFQAGVASTVRVIPRVCSAGAAVDATSLATISRSCESVGGSLSNVSLDGTPGPAGTQNMAVRVGPGVYYFEINAVCETGDTCQIAVQGEGAGQ